MTRDTKREEEDRKTKTFEVRMLRFQFRIPNAEVQYPGHHEVETDNYASLLSLAITR